jgi:uncharacterized protein
MMTILRFIAFSIIVLYFLVVLFLFFLQDKLIFYPGKLPKDYKYKLRDMGEEVWITTQDQEQINGIFFQGSRAEVILYFHGNAGDLSGWQYVTEDFTDQGFSIFIIDYRGYGKSSGTVSEKGFYQDAEAAFQYLINERKISSKQIVVYGRSIGSGVAVELASKHKLRGLILESPYSSFGTLANQKVPFFFPGLYLRTNFNNLAKINNVECPVIMVHGTLDTLIPPSHTEALFAKRTGKFNSRWSA